MRKIFYDNKILVVFSLLLFLSLFFCSNVKANFTDDFPDMVYPVGITPSKNNTDIQANLTRYVCNKVLVKYKGNDSYYIINYISADYNSTRRLYISSNNIVEMEGILYKQYLRWKGSDWSYAGWSGYSGGNASNVNGEISYTTLVNNCEIVSASKNIYKDNTFNEVFFQLTPPVEIPEITQTLVGEVTKAQIMEQIKTMIVGFLKYLIVLVISLIAFWKGWKFLSTQLRKN